MTAHITMRASDASMLHNKQMAAYQWFRDAHAKTLARRQHHFTVTIIMKFMT